MDYFAGFDFKGFWRKDDEGFRMPLPTDEEIQAYETRLGYKIPEAYIALMRQTQNGGVLARSAIRSENKLLNCTYLVPVAERICEEQEYSKKLPDVGVYFGKNLESNRTQAFAFDYTLCGPTGEPRISFVANTKPHVFETTVVADSFEAFAKLLMKKPKAPPFDFDSIRQPLMEAAKQAFTVMVDRHNDEGVAAFGLYIDDAATMIAAATNTRAALQSILESHPDQEEFYTYATTEWAYEGYGADDLLRPISDQLAAHVSLLGSGGKVTAFRNKVIDVLVETLGELKKKGFFFDACGENITLMVNISNDDLSKAKRKKIIATLNQ